MQRQKFLEAIGSLTGVSRFGNRADSSKRPSPDTALRIDVVAVPTGAIGLYTGDDAVVQPTDTPGELAIDSSARDAAGDTTISQIVVGSFHHTHVGSGPDEVAGTHVFGHGSDSIGTVHPNTMSAWGYAFKVVNESTADRNVTMTVEADRSPVDGYLGVGLERPWEERRAIEIEGDRVLDSAVITDVPPNGVVYVSFVASTIDAEDAAIGDLSGTVSVRSD